MTKKGNPGILDWLFDFLVSPIANAIKGLIANPLEVIKTVSPITAVHDALRLLAPIITDIDKRIAPAVITSPSAASAAAVSLVGSADKGLEDITTATIAIEAGTMGLVDVTIDRAARLPAPRFLDTFASGIREERFTSGFLQFYRRYLLSQYMPLLPESYRLALAMSKGIIPDDTYFGAMAESGLDSYWAMVWGEENYVFPDFGVATELYWRGVIDDATFDFIMIRNGYKPEAITAMKALRVSIPPATDLITMVVREAFLPEMVVTAPDVFTKYMAMRGYTSEWSDRYWTAHFLPIPLGQAYDNLRRGYWTKEQFEFALRIADVHPRWYEDIYNVAFNPPSIREMGYGYDVGAYTEEDIIRYRRWGGLSEEDAKKAALAMVAYRTEAEREAVRREYLRLFALGRITEDSFLSQLQRLGTAPPAIALWIERGRLEAERRSTEPAEPEQRIISSSEALYAFRNGLRDEAWTRLCLTELGWTSERVDLAIMRVEFEIMQAVKPPVVEELKLPTIAMVRDYYKYGHITADQIPLFLADLGYSGEDAVTMGAIIAQEVEAELAPKRLTEADAESLYDMRLLGLNDTDALNKVRVLIGAEGADGPTMALYGYYRSAKYSDGDAARLVLMTGLRFAFPDLRAMYSKGWITPDVMVSELMRLGLPKNRAAELAMTVVKAEQPARTVTEKDLTKAEVIKGWKAGIVTTGEAIGLLQGLGYDQYEAEYILAINAITAKADPEGYWEMRAVVEASKKARGLPSVEIPPEVIRLEAEIKKSKLEIQRLQAEKATEEAVGEAAVRLAGIEAELRNLILSKKL